MYGLIRPLLFQLDAERAHRLALAWGDVAAASGIGRMLLERVIESARQMGYPAVTLTTFREVPWNAPFYTRLGFAMLDELTLPAGLAAKREQETRHGLPPESRCAMRLAL